MKSNIERYKKDIEELTKLGDSIFKRMKKNENLAELRQEFELWYSESFSVVKIILPDRISDFSKMYRGGFHLLEYNRCELIAELEHDLLGTFARTLSSSAQCRLCP